MKTRSLTALAAALAALALSGASALGQFETSFKTLDLYGANHGVEVINKETTSSASIYTKQAFLEPAFQKAIVTYAEALDKKKLSKAIDPLWHQTIFNGLGRYRFNVMILGKNDTQDHPMTWWCGTFNSTVIFVTKINYAFIDKMSEENAKTRLEHLALHELAHVVTGNVGQRRIPIVPIDWDDPEKVPGESDDEKVKRYIAETQRRIEYVVYLAVGKERYVEFLKAWFTDDNPNIAPKTLELDVERWLRFLGVWEEKVER